jgi:Rieske Fe-S protein
MSDCSGDCALRRATTAPAGPSRREFVNAALLASVGAFLSACGDGNIGGITGTGGTGGTTPPPPPGGAGGFIVTLADFAALASNGGIARVDGNTSTPIAVTRANATTYLAFSMICPHAGYRPIDIVASGFQCPNHGAEFAADGNWTGGQRTRDLTQYTVVFNAGAGTITIT